MEASAPFFAFCETLLVPVTVIFYCKCQDDDHHFVLLIFVALPVAAATCLLH